MSPKRIATGILFVVSLTTELVMQFLYFFFRFSWIDSAVLPTLSNFLRKEVIQPHLPIRLPCYDFTPVITPAFGSSFPLLNTTDSVPYFFTDIIELRSIITTSCSLGVRSLTSGIRDSHGVTGGVYKTRERIHRDILIRDY